MVSHPAGRDLSFKGCAFHRIIMGFMAQGGDITNGDGTGLMSRQKRQALGKHTKKLHRPCDMIDVTCHRKMRFGSGFACRCFEGGDTKCEQSIFHEFFIKLSGGRSIYGPCFADEAFTRLHARANILSMANSGPNTKLCY